MPLVRISSCPLYCFFPRHSQRNISQTALFRKLILGSLHDLAWSIRKLASSKPQRQVSSIKDMQLTLPFLHEILPQTAPNMRRGEVHAVLTENQRGHHYLEGLDLLAWGGCHLGLSLQLDSSNTTLLLRTGTGRAWNVSGRKCIVQDMMSPYLLWEREGLLSIAPPYTGLSNCRLPILKLFCWR